MRACCQPPENPKSLARHSEKSPALSALACRIVRNTPPTGIVDGLVEAGDVWHGLTDGRRERWEQLGFGARPALRETARDVPGAATR